MRSGIGFDKKQTLALRGLGLRRIRHTVEVADTPAHARVDSEGAAPGDSRPSSEGTVMSLNNLRPPKGAKHARKRVGRGPGSGHGKTASRGSKGAKSRSGFRFKRGFEGGQMPLHRRVPKRGFHNPFRVEYAVVNLDTLAEVFDAGSAVTPELLRERGLVREARAPIKVLGRGEISEEAHRAGAQVQRIGGGEDRGGRRRGGGDQLAVTSDVGRTQERATRDSWTV